MITIASNVYGKKVPHEFFFDYQKMKNLLVSIMV